MSESDEPKLIKVSPDWHKKIKGHPSVISGEMTMQDRAEVLLALGEKSEKPTKKPTGE